MKLKLDENLGQSTAKQLHQAGFDVTTVAEQNMRGSSDDVLIEVFRSEHRCLVTLDMGFANPLLYEPTNYAGIAVIRLPKGQLSEDILLAINTLINGLKIKTIKGQLWVIHRNRIRQYKHDNKS
ncbi:MAG: DUF5615 family PIN-like protein, partial [Calditrichaeota bacterium]|nr:DUF5615 family PIN-like protein [Calditrichota bacterium]